MAKFGGTRATWRARARLTAAVGTLALLSTMVVVAPYSIEAQAASVGTGSAPTGIGEREADAVPADDDGPSLALADVELADVALVNVADAFGFAAPVAQQEGSTTSTTSDTATTTSSSTTDPGGTAVESVPAIDPSVPAADLSIAITPDRNPVLSESFLTFTVEVANAGPAEAVNAVATIALPDYMSFIALTDCWLANSTFPECHLNEIPAGESRSFEILVLVGPGAAGPQTTGVSVTSETADPDPTNNTATADNRVSTRATWRDIAATSDVSIAKIDLVDPVPALGTISYSITVANAGPNAAVDTVVTETLPAGVTVVSTSGCRGSSGVPTCDLGTIPPRQTRTFELVVTADPGTVGEITNAVSVATRSNDTNGSNNTATETTTVNTAPVAVDDTAMLAENASATALDVTANDTDTDNDVLTVTSIDASGTIGVVTLAGGIVSYDPNGQFDALAVGDTAIDTFTYDISDGNGGTDSATVTVTINGVNEAPVAVDDAATVGEDDPAVAIDVATNDTDANGDTLTPTAVANAGTAGLASVAAGVVSYSPNGAFEALNTGDTATDTFGYTIDDGNGGTDDATVTVTVTGVNDAPTITTSAAASVAENTTAVTDVDATDPEGETEGGGGLTYALSGTDAGAFTFSAATGVLTFTTAPDFDTPGDSNTDNDYQVTVTVTDSGLLTDTQDITVTVTNANEAPTILAPNAGNIDENLVLASDVIDSSDPDGETDNGGGLVYSVTGPDAAEFSIGATGVLNFAAHDFENPADVGADNTYNVTFVVTDAGGLTDTQDFALTVNDVNEAPTITAPAAVSVPENTTAVTDVDATDPEGETEGGGGLTYALSGTDAGAFTFSATTGVLTFTTAPDFDIPGDSNTDNDYQVTVTVTDSGLLTDTQDITVTVTNANEAPTILAPNSGTINENSVLALDVIDSSDPDGETDNGGGLVYSVTGPDAAEFSIGATGVLNFAAHDFENPTDIGADNTYNATFVVTDAGGLTDTQDFVLTVNNINEAPTITAPAAVSVPENTTAVTNANATDPEGETEGGGGLTYSLSGLDAGDFTIDAAGNLAFNPAPDFEAPTDTGADNIYNVTITVTDSGTIGSGGAKTDTQDIAVTVTDGNEIPVITSNGGGDTAAISVAENTTAVTDVESTDGDGEAEGAGLVYALSGPDAGAFTIDANTGVLTFNPAPDFDIPTDVGGTAGDNIYLVTVTVGDVALATDSQAITVTVTNVNEAPVITTNGGGATAAVSVPENTTLVTNVDATDPDGETENDTPPDGLKYSRSGPDSAFFSIDDDGNLAFISPADFEAPRSNIYTVTVFVTDQNGTGLADSQIFTITVTDQPDPPIITSDGGGDTATINVAEGTTAVTDVNSTDQEGATEGAGLTYVLTGDDAGLFTFDGATGVLAFAAVRDFETPGSNSGDNNYQVTVTVTDPQTLTDAQDITITVTNVNEAPTITAAATATVAENSTGTTIDADATDPEGEIEGSGLTYSLSGPDAGDFTIDAAGNLAFNPAPDFEAPADTGGDNIYNLTVTVTDSGTIGTGGAQTDSQAVEVTVTDVAEPPVITSDGGGDTAAVTVMQGNTAVTDVDATDDDGGTLTYSISGGTNAALFTIDSGSGVLTFLVAPVATATLEVIVTVTDNTAPTALTDSQTITVTVPPNTAPNAVDDNYSGVPINTELRAGLGASGNPNVAFADGVLTLGTDDSDPEANPLTLTGIVGCADVIAPFDCATTGGGTVSMNADGTFSYVSQVGETATGDTFQYTLSDGSLTDTGLVSIGLFPAIWFIDNAAGGTGGSGTSNNPFKRTTDFNSATTGTGDRVHLASGTYTDGVTLLNGQELYGRGVDFSSGFLTIPAGTVPTITTPSGNGVNLASGNTVRGLNIGNTAGHAISGSTVGTPVINSVNITGSGGILAIAGGNLSIVVLGTQTSSSSVGAAIDLSGLTGTYVGGSPSITSSSGSGIRLLNNSGASISFTGVTINNSATNQPGIVGSGGGTLQISGPGGGTVNAGSATAVQISGMSLGILLTRVDSVGGATPGISLTNTTGFFTIAGSSTGCKDSVASCSGGAIAGKTGNTDGVLLNNVVMVTLNDMNISNNTGNGINATTVNGFLIDDSRLDGNADSIAQLEAALKFTNLSGNAIISNTTVSNTFADSVMLDNNVGTVTVNLTNSTIAPNNAANGDNGVQLVSTGSATLNVNVNGTAFTGAGSVMLFVDVGGTGGGTVNVGNSTANTFTQGQVNQPSGGAIEVLASGSGNPATVTMNIRNNTILAGSNTFEGDTIVVGNGFGFAGATNITLDNNQVGTSGANGSATNPAGGQGDGGIVVTQNGTGTMNALLNNNRVFDFNDRGIEIFYDAEGPSDPAGGTLNITIMGNTIADAGAENHALQFTGGDFVNSCMQVANNTLTSAGDEIRVDVFGETGVAFNVVGLAAPFTEANIAALWTGANTLGGVAPNVQVFSLAPSTIGGAVSCPQP